MHTALVPEVAFIVHKMSVYSVTLPAVRSAVYSAHIVHFHSHFCLVFEEIEGRIVLNKEFITSINIDVISRVCVFMLHFEKTMTAVAELQWGSNFE